LEYDGGGRKLVQHYDPKQGGNGVDKRDEYVFDGLDPVAEYKMLNGQRTDYYRGAGNHLALMHSYKGGTQGQMYWYHYNNKGDVVGRTKHNGNSHHNYRYDPYGAVLPENGNFTDPHNHYTLTGKEFDENTGLVWFGARHYEPETGVWMGQDSYRGTLDAPVSLHRYQYVFNNPPNWIDPLGFWGWKDAGNAGLAVVDLVSGIGKAFGAGVTYGAATLAGGPLTPLGAAGYAKGTSMVGAAISDIDDSSKKLTSSFNNAVATFTDIPERTPDQIDGIFSPITKNKYLETPLKVNQTAWGIVDIFKSGKELWKGGSKIVDAARNGDILSAFSKRMKYVPDEWILMMKGKKYLMPKLPVTMWKNFRNGALATYGVINNIQELTSKCTSSEINDPAPWGGVVN
jgi:RHS repeat-associated protein